MNERKVAFLGAGKMGEALVAGLIRAGGKVYWVYQFSGFEEEWYEVAEPNRGKVDAHVSFLAGGC